VRAGLLLDRQRLPDFAVLLDCLAFYCRLFCLVRLAGVCVRVLQVLAELTLLTLVVLLHAASGISPLLLG
jgi:hypothetical protein